jgi:hypothetical protein
MNKLIYLLAFYCLFAHRTVFANTMQTKEILKLIAQGKAVAVSNTTIKGKLDFTQLEANTVSSTKKLVQVPVTLAFINCNFEEAIIGYTQEKESSTQLHFLSAVTFENCQFKEDILLRNVLFSAGLQVEKCVVSKSFSAEGSVFSGKSTTFSETQFNGEVKLENTHFEGDANFFKTIFQGNLSLQGACFKAETQWGSVQINKYADFSLTRFRDGFFCNRAIFNGRCNFTDAIFWGRTEFQQTNFNDNINFENGLFYAKVKFNQANFNGTLTLNQAVFFVKPEFLKVSIDKKKIKMEQVSYHEPQLLSPTSILE